MVSDWGSDEVHNSFSFLDDSGTATLKARPGPRVRPVLQFSASHTEIQGLAVPTPSVPSGYTDNPSLGNGPKFNGNYRLYSSVGDLRLMSYEYSDEEIPAPPSVPPPPPPTMITVAPSQESNYSSTISSPSSPSPPDFIPPTPNSSAPSVPNFLPYTDASVASTEQQSTDVTNWKSGTDLSAGQKEMSMSLPNRFSLNPAVFQDSRGQTITEADPQSTLPKSFKVPPPAPIRTSSIQLQEYHDISYSKASTQSPVRSSFNPNAQAKLFSVQENKLLNDTANKRKSMLIMDDQQDVFQNIDLAVQKPSSVVDFPSGTLAQKSSADMKTAELEAVSRTQNGLLSDSRQGPEPGFDNEPEKQSNNINTPVNGITLGKKERSSHSLSSTELTKMPLFKDDVIENGHKSLKPKILSMKPILTNLPISTINVQTKQNSLTRKETTTLPKEREKMQNDLKLEQKEIAEVIQDAPPSPPPMSPPPPPPLIMPPKPPTIPPPPPLPFAVTPPKTSPLTSPPGSPLVALTSPVPQVSPLLPSKPKISTSLTPPIPPSLSKTESSKGPQVPLLKALQEKQQTLRQIPKKSVEIRSAHVSSVSIDDDNDQKARVGKIKGELEALFSPKKDEKVGELKNVRLGSESNKKNMEANKKNGNTQSKDGENTLVNSLMLKVPLMSVKQDKEELDGDFSDWNTKNSKADIQIPEPDYQPTTPNQKTERLDFSSMHSEIIMPMAEMSSRPVQPLKVTDVPSTLDNIPTYKPHSDRKEFTESWTLDKISLKVPEPVAFEHQKPDTDHSNEETTASVILNSTANENVNKHLDTGEQEEISSPMALLMAAKRRAQKGNRSAALERSNLPKISLSRGIVKSTFSSQCNEEKINTSTFPKKENAGYFSQQVTNFIANPSNPLDPDLSISRWTDRECKSSSLNTVAPNSQKSDKATFIHTGNESFGKVSPEDRNEDFQNDKFVQYSDSTKMASFIDGPAFNISAVPSPIPASKRDELIDYGILPPPAEFMNSPPTVDIVSHERGLYNTNLKSGLMAGYGRNNQPLVSQTSSSSSSDFNKYRSGPYSTEVGRDQQKASLIKKRLYMPAPDSMSSYGKSTNTLRTSAYNHVHVPSTSSIVSEQWRSTNPSRYLSQGRRVPSENLNRMVSPITDLKYKPQNPEYSIGKETGRPQSTYQQGMTFTVRPGTRQPITQMYQGGYL
ncbi:uncharacterized protein C6orf132-like isoform X2 [Hyperolius riggenbachi]|uniref:uncharacterized protein C6orf132-like isoform X2 n=1 Tax=Hyperolius riggenbachi TaxID=752182 RepID=UPI0035A34268